MTSCDLDTSVPDWIIEHPETWAVLQKLGIDYRPRLDARTHGGPIVVFACRRTSLGPMPRRCIVLANDTTGMQTQRVR